MESSNTPAKTKKLKGFTLIELIIVCALFSMILLGALSVLRPVSLLYKQNVEYESSRATSDIVSTYLEGVLKYADRMYFYGGKAASCYEDDPDGEYLRFINRYYDGQAPDQPVYMMSIINDPVVDGSGNIVEEGYGRVYVREIPAGTLSSVNATSFPEHLAISEGIYNDYGFKIEVQNALPKSLTTTIDVYKKNKGITANSTISENGIVSLINGATGDPMYESNGVEVVKSTNMINICYFDIDLHEPTSIAKEVLVREKVADGDDPANAETHYELAFYSNPNSAKIQDDTAPSNNYYIIYTLPNMDQYKEAAKHQLFSISCTPDNIEVPTNTSKTLDQILDENGFTVMGKYTNENEEVEISKGVLRDGTDGWYIRNAHEFESKKSQAGKVTFYVGYLSKSAELTITFKEAPLVYEIKADNLIITNGAAPTESMFDVSVRRKGDDNSLSPISSDSYRVDGLDAVNPTVPGAYPVTITYTGDDADATLTPTTAYVIVTTISGITVTPAADPLEITEGTVITNDNIGMIVSAVTANYHSVTDGAGTVHSVEPQIVTNLCTYTYPTEALVANNNYSVTVEYGGFQQTVGFTAVEVKVSATVSNPTVYNNWGSGGQMRLNVAVQAEADMNWTIEFNLGATGTLGGWGGYNYTGTAGGFRISGTGPVANAELNVQANSTDDIQALLACQNDPSLITYTVTLN